MSGRVSGADAMLLHDLWSAAASNVSVFICLCTYVFELYFNKNTALFLLARGELYFPSWSSSEGAIECRLLEIVARTPEGSDMCHKCFCCCNGRVLVSVGGWFSEHFGRVYTHWTAVDGEFNFHLSHLL